MIKDYKLKSFVLMGFAFLVVCSVRAQQTDMASSKAEEPTKTRTELLNELSLRTALIALEHAKEMCDRLEREYENALRLYKENIIYKKELDAALSAHKQAQQQLKQAEIQLEMTKLSFLSNATHITIMEAKKYYDSQSRRMLDLVLKNTSNLAQAESALGLTESEPVSSSVRAESELSLEWRSPQQIQALLNIENIIVSIVDKSSSIGKPYEQIISVLPFGREVKLKFVLLKDIQEAGIQLQYLKQNVTQYIFLEKESLQQMPTVVASQFSQEGQLGTDIRYDLALEMLVTSDKSFSLLITNMPLQINCSFIDSKSGARITSVRFTEDVSKHDLYLRVSIPQNLNIDMIDETITFQVWVVTSKQLDVINKLKQEYATQPIPTQKFDQIDAGRVDLSLIPKGIGRLEILINNLYVQIKPHHDINIKADLHNTGTLDLFNIIPEISPPLDWTAQVLPKSVAKLAPRDKKTIKIHLQPSSDVSVGDYEALIEARGQSGSRIAEALRKRLKIHIRAETHIVTTLILVLALVGLIGTMVFFGVKLSRR